MHTPLFPLRQTDAFAGPRIAFIALLTVGLGCWGSVCLRSREHDQPSRHVGGSEEHRPLDWRETDPFDGRTASNHFESNTIERR